MSKKEKKSTITVTVRLESDDYKALVGQAKECSRTLADQLRYMIKSVSRKSKKGTDNDKNI